MCRIGCCRYSHLLWPSRRRRRNQCQWVPLVSTLYTGSTAHSTNVIDRYPYGPARNPTSVQRGSVQYLSVYPGDPTTPGYPSYENSTRTEGENVPKIPSLPISWTNFNVVSTTLTKGHKFEGKRVRLLNNGQSKNGTAVNGASCYFEQWIQESFLYGIHWALYLAISRMKWWLLEIIEMVCLTRFPWKKCVDLSGASSS